MILCAANWFHASTISITRRSNCCRSRRMRASRCSIWVPAPGLLSAMIAAAFPKARLTLFDLTPEMLMIARARLKPLGKRVRFVTADFAADIFKYLTSGGVFINADQVGGETAAIEQRSRQMWTKRARELKVAERDLNAAIERMKHDLPATVGQQLA